MKPKGRGPKKGNKSKSTAQSVSLLDWPDYVFKPKQHLRPLVKGILDQRAQEKLEIIGQAKIDQWIKTIEHWESRLIPQYENPHMVFLQEVFNRIHKDGLTKEECKEHSRWLLKVVAQMKTVLDIVLSKFQFEDMHPLACN